MVELGEKLRAMLKIRIWEVRECIFRRHKSQISPPWWFLGERPMINEQIERQLSYHNLECKDRS